jgi:hypothetical protein
MKKKNITSDPHPIFSSAQKPPMDSIIQRLTRHHRQNSKSPGD